MTGKIISFSPKKGYGFIAAKGNEYWFHASEWMGNGKPKVGEEVDCVLIETPKGLRAFVVSGIRKERLSNGK